MKLSDLEGTRALDAIADLIEPLANIATNRNKLKFEKIEPIEGESSQDTTIRRMKAQLPVILRENKTDILSIIGIVTGEDANKMPLPRIMKEAFDLLGDKDLGDLFLSVAPMVAKKQPTESSEIAETTEPES